VYTKKKGQEKYAQAAGSGKFPFAVFCIIFVLVWSIMGRGIWLEAFNGSVLQRDSGEGLAGVHGVDNGYNTVCLDIFRNIRQDGACADAE
jgi:hypothetical protein